MPYHRLVRSPASRINSPNAFALRLRCARRRCRRRPDVLVANAVDAVSLQLFPQGGAVGDPFPNHTSLSNQLTRHLPHDLGNSCLASSHSATQTKLSIASCTFLSSQFASKPVGHSIRCHAALSNKRNRVVTNRAIPCTAELGIEKCMQSV